MFQHEPPDWAHESRSVGLGFLRRRYRGAFGGRGAMFGPGRFGGSFGPGPSGRGRRRRGDVRAAILQLLAEEPRNGYQLMQTLEERTGGRWRPSPGSVYPALAQLEDEGLVRSVEGESGRTFEITDTGRQQVAKRGEEGPPWEAEAESDDSFHAYRHAVISTAKAAWQVAHDGDQQQIAKATELLNETRRALYRLLAGDGESGEESR